MPNQRGFTLMELLLAIAVLAIVTTAALPSFTQFIQNNRLAGEGNELVTAFQMARSEALRRRVPVTVCASTDGNACGGNWVDGWIVIPEQPDAEALRVWSAPGPGFQITSDGGQGFQFRASGFSNAAQAVTIELQLDNCTGNNGRRLLLEPSGRVSIERTACS